MITSQPARGTCFYKAHYVYKKLWYHLHGEIRADRLPRDAKRDQSLQVIKLLVNPCY